MLMELMELRSRFQGDTDTWWQSYSMLTAYRGMRTSGFSRHTREFHEK